MQKKWPRKKTSEKNGWYLSPGGFVFYCKVKRTHPGWCLHVPLTAAFFVCVAVIFANLKAYRVEEALDCEPRVAELGLMGTANGEDTLQLQKEECLLGTARNCMGPLSGE